ncbi:DUF6457 domain-containing protein [Cryptosporangium aurantiacum]|uniref:DUF6457 domain-containing protein n=1 Tax=Cryptosporangium aurantiacum TaxID=134849 RepID=A0A1M7RCH9_9ACTN|nr:DUF6457 domain-containing protein [Cryptosporangium aurantiacum]SHN43997.1 hypothetical protein SAMN05443668_1108 [Cryptosporangium aurantiacum]
MSNLDDWVAAVSVDLGLDKPVDRSLVLDLARDVAHGVARPAAPLTTYLLGLAVGAGADPRAAATAISALAEGWNPDRVSETTLED